MKWARPPRCCWSRQGNQRGFFVSWQAISQGISALLGASLGLALTYFLPEQALYAWGWRVPFIIGLLIIPVGIYIRKHLEETYSGEAPAHARPPLNPVWDLVSNHAKDLLLGVLIIMSGTVMVYVVLLYMPTYMMQTYHIACPTAYLFSCIASVVQIIAVYCAGRYVDRVQNYKRPLLFSIFAALLLIYPTFWFLSATQTLWLAIVFRILLIGALGINMLASTMLIVSALPRHVRATGTSMIYAFGVTLFGGSAQLVVTWLLDVSGNPMAPAWYVTGMLTVSLIATLLFRERHKE
ncbi:MFS transporter [Serratia sarumanii]